jgi:two-component system response regulator FlrC
MPDRLAELERLEALAELLPMVAGSLDVREVFERLSHVTRRVLPHDAMALVLIDDDREHVRFYAVSADIDFDRPDVLPIPAGERARILGEPWEFLLIHDARDLEDWKDLPPVRAGYRSSLRVPIRSSGDLLGGVNFLSREPGAFSETDVPVARRVADYVALALSHQELSARAAREAAARERAGQLERRVEALTTEIASLTASPHRIVGPSAAWKAVLREAARVAPTEATVLVTGESGTGKEVVARFIHQASPRAAGPFLAVNCASLPDPLLESELFGFERGAFTGAVQAKPGRLELAAGGVLFLDEVAEMSPPLQAKLLRVLQEREFQRLGATRTLKADVRVLAATNRDLRRLMANGEFREDLFYRLNVFEIHLAPLRERPEDILPLCGAFLEEIGRALGRPPAGLSREARPLLLAYAWPGNARELRNVLERASILADGGLITREHLGGLESGTTAPPALKGPASADEPRGPAPANQPGPALADESRGRLADTVRAPDQRQRDDGGRNYDTTAADGLAEQGQGGSVGDTTSRTTDLPSIERDLVERVLRESRYNKTRAAKRLGLTRAQLYVRLKRHGL